MSTLSILNNIKKAYYDNIIRIGGNTDTLEYFDDKFPNLAERLFSTLDSLLEKAMHDEGWNKTPRNVNDKTRLIPCQICGYPLSQRHHLLSYGEFGENDSIVCLCANCHGFYHLLWSALALESKTAKHTINSIAGKIPTPQFVGVFYLYYVTTETMAAWDKYHDHNIQSAKIIQLQMDLK